MMKYIMFIYFTLGLYNNIEARCTYPFSNQAHQHRISGTVGEARGGTSRFHYGLDFNVLGGTRGTEVYSIEPGCLLKVTDNAEFPDGRQIYFQVTTTDLIGNGALNILPVSDPADTVPTTFFTLDNFWPYITSVSVSQDNIQIFNMTRGISEGYNAVDNRHLETKHSNSKNE